MSESVTFGKKIKEARLVKRYTQTEVATFVSIDTFCLSKIENESTDCLLEENIIEKIADCLDLNCQELMFLKGHLPSVYQDVVKHHYQFLADLFLRLRSDRELAQKLLEKL